MDTKELTRVVITISIVERDGRFLLVRRVDSEPIWHHKWELPGGKIDHHETPPESAIREIYEETGLRVPDVQLLDVYTHHWHLKDRIQQTIILVYRGESPTGEVKLDPRENDHFQWVTVDEFFAMDEDSHLEANYDIIRKIYLPHLEHNST